MISIQGITLFIFAALAGAPADTGFPPGIQKPASTRSLRPNGFNRRISAFSRDGFLAAAAAAFELDFFLFNVKIYK